MYHPTKKFEDFFDGICYIALFTSKKIAHNLLNFEPWAWRTLCILHFTFEMSCLQSFDVDVADVYLERVKSTLSHVLAQIGIYGLMPDGSVPNMNIGDITVRGYNLNALECASRRGNHEIAEWLSTDSRTKVMLTRTDSAPVAWACYTGNVELARMLVKHVANSHATTDVVLKKKTPTHLAAENSKLLAAKYLVEECGHGIRERDCSGSNIRTCIRKNFSEWRDLPGSVAVDEYAKSKGVRAYS